MFRVLTVQRMNSSIAFHRRLNEMPKTPCNACCDLPLPIRQIVPSLVAILSTTDHLPQLIFLGELALKLIKLSDKVLA